MKIFSLLAGIISVYTMLCFVRIILTWIPNLNYSKFGQLLASICDPYMNYFRNIRFLRIGNMDFSPVLSIGLLVVASNLLSTLAVTGQLKIGYLIASIISMIWSILASILSFLIILLIIRVIALFVSKGNSTFWYSLDKTLNPVVYKVAGIFRGRNTFMTQKTAYVITIVTIFVLRIAGNILFSVVAGLFTRLPF
ncbi:MAG: YggT family protein [Spirochaetaceae bacterium]|nr:YggT family protein [Spirochaetaceae bacterium]MBQ7366763.1 YggT family protein [Spirochaetaceae bacterium]MBQ8383936.1 YggT family protein [Spirochaetaceae bacterium]MBQ8560136.1 YggT family protein [Spirochaetaceae bacterium]MBR2361175.1 YggT family protein [Spirochaetaceae bacterium]